MDPREAAKNIKSLYSEAGEGISFPANRDIGRIPATATNVWRYAQRFSGTHKISTPIINTPGSDQS